MRTPHRTATTAALAGLTLAVGGCSGAHGPADDAAGHRVTQNEAPPMNRKEHRP